MVDGDPRSKVRRFFIASGAVGLVVLFNAMIFRNTFLRRELFIGDSDRLNTFLNLRLASLREIAETGRAMTWNENMFMGFNTAGLHWIFPVGDPIGYLLALLEPSDPFWAMNVISSFQLVATGLLAYLFVHDVVPSRIPALVGACLYSLSVFSVQHISQADSSHLVIALLPLAMYFVNKGGGESIRRAYVGLVLTMSAMLWFSFLQDVAYALFLVGIYGLYRSLSDRNPRFITTTVVAGLVAVVIALPRLVTVYEELELLVRSGHFKLTASVEVLRLLNDGIFGRYFAEANAFGNWLNLHEGLQLLHSTAAVVVALAGLAYARSRARKVLLSVVLVFLFALPFVYEIALSRSFFPMQFFQEQGLSHELFACAIVAASIAIWAFLWSRWGPRRPRSFILPDDPQTLFGAMVLVFVLAGVLVPEFRYVLYVLFMRLDFLHSRISMIAILPLAVMTASHLHALERQGGLSPRAQPFATYLAVVSAILFMVLLQPEVIGEILPEFVLFHRYPLNILGVEALCTVIIMAVALVLFLLGKDAVHSKTRTAAYSALIALILAETFLHADVRVNGIHTETYPIPFDKSSFFNAPEGAFVNPNRDAIRRVRGILESDRFRSAAVARPLEFPRYGGTAPHLSQYWALRFAEGYSTGFPKRLAALPWQGSEMILREISFRDDEKMPAALLAILNVKYLLKVTPALYYNSLGENADSNHLTFAKNPYPVLPRQFFVQNVQEWPADVVGYREFVAHLSELKQKGTYITKFVPDSESTLLDLLTVPSGDQPADGPVAVVGWPGAHLAWESTSEDAVIRIERRIDGTADINDMYHLLDRGPWGSRVVIPVNRKGRFVRIQASDHRHLSLREIEVRGCSPEHVCGDQSANLALGRPVRHSGVRNWGADRAVDGRLDTQLATDRHEHPWLEVDLEHQLMIKEIVVYPSDDRITEPPLQDVNIFVTPVSLRIKQAPSALKNTLPTSGFVRVAEVPESVGAYLDVEFPTGFRGAYRLTRCTDGQCAELTTLKVSHDLGQVVGDPPAMFAPIIEEELRIDRTGGLVKGRVDPRRLMNLSYVDSPKVMAERLDGRNTFPSAGRIEATYRGDRVHLRVEAADDDRVLVMNELYHPGWRAWADEEEVAIFPVNIAMRGMVVPAGTQQIELRFTPFATSAEGNIILAFGIGLSMVGWMAMGWVQKRYPTFLG